MHTWGKRCEYKALETGPEMLDAITEFHSICKFSPCFQGNHEYTQPLLFPGHALFLYWIEIYLFSELFFFFPAHHSFQAEEMDTLLYDTDKH